MPGGQAARRSSELSGRLDEVGRVSLAVDEKSVHLEQAVFQPVRACVCGKHPMQVAGGYDR